MNNIEVTIMPAAITTNFADIELQLRDMMEAYADLVVTEENIPERKADVATLRKIKAEIETRRKGVKKEYEKPLKAFETQVKRLTGIVDEQIDRINAGLSEYEAKRRQEKEAHCVELYNDNIGEYADFLPYTQVFNQAWLNKTCSDTAIVSELQELVVGVKRDLDTIKALNSEIEEECIKAYRQSGNNLSAAIKRDADYRHDAAVVAQRAAESVSNAKVEEVPTEAPKTPQRAAESHIFTVYNDKDAKAVRDFLIMFDIKYSEGA